MKIPKVVVVDYDMGNIFSIEWAIKFVGGSAVTTNDPKIISSADRIILPGVGAFGSAIKYLSDKGIKEAIYSFIAKSRPLLGICLGMQLLMSESFEFGIHKGLDIIKGKVVKFTEPVAKGEKFKIPHIGWSKLDFSFEKNNSWSKTILEGLSKETLVYFVHSYFVRPNNPENILSETIYGNDRFCSTVFLENIYGCQFHPEKSGEAGLLIYKNFLFNV